MSPDDRVVVVCQDCCKAYHTEVLETLVLSGQCTNWTVIFCSLHVTFFCVSLLSSLSSRPLRSCFRRIIFFVSSSHPLMSSALHPLLSPAFPCLRLPLATCTSCSVNSRMLALSSIGFVFSASFSSVSLLGSSLASNFVWYVFLASSFVHSSSSCFSLA